MLAPPPLPRVKYSEPYLLRGDCLFLRIRRGKINQNWHNTRLQMQMNAPNRLWARGGTSKILRAIGHVKNYQKIEKPLPPNLPKSLFLCSQLWVARLKLQQRGQARELSPNFSFLRFLVYRNHCTSDQLQYNIAREAPTTFTTQMRQAERQGRRKYVQTQDDSSKRTVYIYKPALEARQFVKTNQFLNLENQAKSCSAGLQSKAFCLKKEEHKAQQSECQFSGLLERLDSASQEPQLQEFSCVGLFQDLLTFQELVL